ncbi:MAG: flagellar hook capping protein [Oscillibacter sp.]|nr:flagellar hook capping protein [Oscillibacter sp.]
MGTMADVSGILGGVTSSTGSGKKIATKDDNMTLNMTDFLTLMVTELTNQGIDNTMDTSEMLNQMVQMQMVQAMVNMTDASVMTYAASLVGKEVTVSQGLDSNNKVIEYTGKVIGTGQYNGEQVIFLDDDKYYKMSEILAVGRLPEKKPGDEDGSDKVEDTDKTEGTDKPTEPETKPEETTT